MSRGRGRGNTNPVDRSAKIQALIELWASGGGPKPNAHKLEKAAKALTTVKSPYGFVLGQLQAAVNERWR